MSTFRKYKIGDKLLVPLLKNKDGTNGAPVYSIRDRDVSSLSRDKTDSIELEICGVYQGNYQGINSPYLFKIPDDKISFFKTSSGVLGTKFESLTPEMQKLTFMPGSKSDLFYAIEQDATEQVCTLASASVSESKKDVTQTSVSKEAIKPTPVSKEQSNMSNSKTPGQIFKSDLEKSAYRVAARQSAKAAKTAILSIVKSKETDKRKQNKTASAVQEILDTDLGTYGVSEALGWMLTYAPGLKEHPRAQLLAEELRVEGLAGAGDMAFDKIIQSLVPSMVSVLNSLPAVEQEASKQEAAKKLESKQNDEQKQEVELEVVTLQTSSK